MNRNVNTTGLRMSLHRANQHLDALLRDINAGAPPPLSVIRDRLADAHTELCHAEDDVPTLKAKLEGQVSNLTRLHADAILARCALTDEKAAPADVRNELRDRAVEAIERIEKLTDHTATVLEVLINRRDPGEDEIPF